MADAQQRGMGRGLAAILPAQRQGRGRPARDPAGPDPAERAPAAPHASTRLGSRSWPSRSARAACCSRSSSGRWPAAASSWSRASAACAPRRWSELEHDPRARARHRRLGAARPRARGEHGAGRPERDRGGARVRDARRRPRAHQAGGRPAGRPQPRSDLQPDPAARASRGGARADRARRPHARATAARSCSARTTRSGGACALEARDGGWSVRETERRAREAEGQPEPEEKRFTREIHPDLAEALGAAEDTLATALGPAGEGAPARRGGCRVELDFDAPARGRGAGPPTLARGRPRGLRRALGPPLQRRSTAARPRRGRLAQSVRARL